MVAIRAASAAVLLLLGAQALLAESVLIPSVSSEGKLSLIHASPQSDGTWATEELALPTLQGIEPNFIDFPDGRLVLSSVVRTMELTNVRPDGQALLWVSACFQLDKVVDAIRTQKLQEHLSDTCPFNSHSLAAFRRMLGQDLERRIGGKADWQRHLDVLDRNPGNQFMHFTNGSRSLTTVGASFKKTADPETDFTMLYLVNFDSLTLDLIGDGLAGPYRFGGRIQYNRYLSYLRKDSDVSRILESGSYLGFDRANKALKAFVYDAETGRHIFESSDTYGGIRGHIPEVNPQGSYIVWSIEDQPVDPAQVLPFGNGGLHLFDLASGSSVRMTTPDVHAAFNSWAPDGVRFIFTTTFAKTTTYFLGRTDGTKEQMNWNLNSIPDMNRAITSGQARRAWLSNGNQFISVWAEYIERVEGYPRYRIRLVLSDLAKQSSTVVAEYELVERKPLFGGESTPVTIP